MYLVLRYMGISMPRLPYRNLLMGVNMAVVHSVYDKSSPGGVTSLSNSEMIAFDMALNTSSLHKPPLF